MVETISPVVHGGRARWLGTLVAAHARRGRHRGAVRRDPRLDRERAGRPVAAARSAGAGHGLGRLRARSADATARAGAAAPPAGARLVADVLRTAVRGVVVRRRPGDRVRDVPVERCARGRRVRGRRERTAGGRGRPRGAVRPGARALRGRLVALGDTGAQPRARRPAGRDERVRPASRERPRALAGRGRGRRGIGPRRPRAVVAGRGRRARLRVRVGERVEDRRMAPVAPRPGRARTCRLRSSARPRGRCPSRRRSRRRSWWRACRVSRPCGRPRCSPCSRWRSSGRGAAGGVAFRADVSAAGRPSTCGPRSPATSRWC